MRNGLSETGDPMTDTAATLESSSTPGQKMAVRNPWVGRSGVGREGLPYAFEEYTQPKFTGIRLP
jgi:hypothetical protein